MSRFKFKDKYEEVKDLRKQLDKGDITVADFLEQGQKLADEGLASIRGWARGGAEGANTANPYLEKFKEVGFGYDESEKTFTPHLPAKFQDALREEMLPENLSPEERERYKKLIPNDIGFDTDRFKIEREGIRQQYQQEQGLTQQKTIQQKRLDDLRTALMDQTSRQFQRDVNPIAGESQNAGLLETSGFGDALARRHKELDERSQDIITAQSLSDRDLEVGSISQALAQRQGFQTAGLDRTFSTTDRANQFNQAMMLANLSKPQGQSGGKGGGGAVPGAAAGLQAGSAFGPWGGVAGAVIGGAGGYAATR